MTWIKIKHSIKLQKSPKIRHDAKCLHITGGRGHTTPGERESCNIYSSCHALITLPLQLLSWYTKITKKKNPTKDSPNINCRTPGNPRKSSKRYRTRDSMSIRSCSNVLAYSDKLSISRVFCKVGTSSSASGSQRSSPEVVTEEPKELVSSVILTKQHRNRTTSPNSQKSMQQVKFNYFL